MTILGPFCCLILGIWGVKTNLIFSKYGPKTGQTVPRPDGHQHGFPNYLWQWDDHWYFFNSIQVKCYIEVNMYHIQLHNEDWNPQAYVLRKPCSHLMSTVEESSMIGVTKKWTRSELWRQQCTSKGKPFNGWYITGNPHMIMHIMWSPWQPEWYKMTPPTKMDILAGKSKVVNIFAYNQPRLSIVACISMLTVINDHIGTNLLFYF